jgi:hypothetical protein
MALVYLKGEDVETTEYRRLARLLSIAHECYEDYCIIGLSNSNYNNRQTKWWHWQDIRKGKRFVNNT